MGRKFATVLAITAATSSLALAERIADPFDRHDNSYALEGPQHPSDIFYVSSNYIDENGEKRDDRKGDTLLLIGFASAVGYVSLKSRDIPLPRTVNS